MLKIEVIRFEAEDVITASVEQKPVEQKPVEQKPVECTCPTEELYDENQHRYQCGHKECAATEHKCPVIIN